MLICGSFILCQFAKADEEPNISWSKTFGGGDNDEGYSVEQTTDGGYIIAGETDSYGCGEGDAWLIKTNANGIEQWNKTYGGTASDFSRFVEQTSDGGYIIVGKTSSYGQGDGDIWLIKTNSDGIEQWNKTHGGISYEWGNSVQQTSDGGYIIVGVTNSYGLGAGDVWLLKTNATGDKQWSKTFGGKSWDVGHSVQKTNDGGYIIAGGTQSFGSGYDDVWLIKTDAAGVEQWNKTYGGLEFDVGWYVLQTSDSGFVIVGETQSYGHEEGDVWLIKTNADGIEQWNKTYGGQYRDEGYSVQMTNDGGYILVGVTSSFTAGGRDTWVIKTNAAGIEQWNITYGGVGYDCGWSVQQTIDEGYLIVGYTGSYGAGGKDIFLIKVTAPNHSAETNSKGTPGFELYIIIIGISLLLILKRKRI